MAGGGMRDGVAEDRVAGLGGTVTSSVGLTTTMLVVAAGEPFPASLRAATAYRRACKGIEAGRPIRIVPAGALPR